jgi:hypothetical protein
MHEMDTPEKIHEMPEKQKGLVHELEGDVVYKEASGKGDEGMGLAMTC